MTTTGRERRRFRRKRVRMRVTYWQEGNDKRSNAYTFDASKGGMYIEAAGPPAAGERFHLELTLPDGSFYSEGIVVRSVRVPQSVAAVKKSGFALRIITLDEILFPGDASSLVEERSAEAPAPKQTDALEIDLRDPLRLFKTAKVGIESGTLIVATSEKRAAGERLKIRLILPAPCEPILFDAPILRVNETDKTVVLQTTDPKLRDQVDVAVKTIARQGVRLTLDLSNPDRLHSTFESELRHGGVLLLLPHPPPIGAQILLTIGLPPPAAPVETTGRVVYASQNPPGAGIQLDEPEVVATAMAGII